jgi:hypothetical protein
MKSMFARFMKTDHLRRNASGNHQPGPFWEMPRSLSEVFRLRRVCTPALGGWQAAVGRILAVFLVVAFSPFVDAYPQYGEKHPNIGGLLPCVVRHGEAFDPMAGVLAYDYEDGYLDSITVTGTVDTSTPGTYALTYSVTDSDSDTKTVERTVTVLADGEFAALDTTGRRGANDIITLDASYLGTLADNLTFIKPVVTAIDGTEYHYKLIERDWDATGYTEDPPSATDWDAAESKEFFRDLYLCMRPRLDRWLKIIVTNGSETREWVYGLKGDPGVLFHSELKNKDYYRLSREVDDSQTAAEQFDAAYAHGASYWFQGTMPLLKQMGGKAEVVTLGSLSDSYGAANKRELHGIYTTIRSFLSGANKRDGSDANWAKVERIWDHTLSRGMNMSYMRSYQIFFSEVKMPHWMEHFEATYQRIRTDYNPERIYIAASNYGQYKDYKHFYDVGSPYFMFSWHKGHFDKMFSEFPVIGSDYPCYSQYPRINEVFAPISAVRSFETHRSVHKMAVENRIEAGILDKCGFMGRFPDGTWAAWALPYFAMWFNYDGYDYLNTGYFFKDDWDGDGLSNGDEHTAGTNPFHPDTDGDGIWDGDEVAWNLDPTDGTDGEADPDGDRMTNFQEWLNSKATPKVPSGTPAFLAVEIDDGAGGKIGLDPHSSADGAWDPDGDLLPTWFEVNTGAQPMDLHTYKDGTKGTFKWFTDVGADYAGMTKMLAYHNNIIGGADADDDGVDNLGELACGMDPNNPDDAAEDWDGDGTTNADEIAAGTGVAGDDADGPAFDALVVRPPLRAQTRLSARSLAWSVSAPDVGERHAFTKLSGPEWLEIDEFGNLSGRPSASDVGMNTWQVQVADGQGRTDTSTLHIRVEEAGVLPPDIEVVCDDVMVSNGDTVPGDSAATVFGPVDVARAVEKTYTIHNYGTEDLDIGVLSASGDGFSVVAEPASTVPGAGTTSFTIRFVPSASGVSVQGTVEFATNDADDNPFSFAVTGSANGFDPATLLAKQSTWKYYDQGDPGTDDWKDDTFDDSAWSEGTGGFAYGESDAIGTTISSTDAGGAHLDAAYFRTTFEIPNLSRIESLVVRLRRDDGAVVYINGIEVFRDNMPTGNVGYSTYANTTIEGANEDAFHDHSVDISPLGLRQGTNTIAVEVHQHTNTSSDLIFDLELAAEFHDAPSFVFDPLRRPGARVGQAYSATLAGDTYNPAGVPEHFSVLSGPAWLALSDDGALSGTPGEADAGLNTWQVQVGDGQGHNETATLKIKVHPARFPHKVAASISWKRNTPGGMQFGYRRAKNASLRYTYEMSEDMVNWTPMDPGSDYTESRIDVSGTEEEVTVDFASAYENLPKAFIRLRLDVVDP